MILKSLLAKNLALLVSGVQCVLNESDGAEQTEDRRRSELKPLAAGLQVCLDPD